MAVYVDEALHKYGRMQMSHLMADTLDELFEMVDKIGVQRKWFQDGRYQHFDICKSKRELAIKHGAISISSQDMVRKFRPNKKESDND